MKYDFIVIGAGIVGLSFAWQLQNRFPQRKILLLEKEADLAKHQTGHNSGVIHSGVYYPPGSLKSEFCLRGQVETIKLCEQHGIPYDRCGKLLVATSESELAGMQSLYDSCIRNRLDCSLLSAADLKRLEPNINGLGAVLVRDSGIVNFRRICRKLADMFTDAGGDIALNNRVIAIEESISGIRVSTGERHWQADFLVCCGGLQADRLARLQGLDIDFQIIPFRGEYYRLPDSMSDLISHLVYPIPDPELPFLGIHLTRMIDDGIIIGPNAVLGWKREGYGRLNFSLRDSLDTLGFSGFWRFAAANYRHGLSELQNSLSSKAYLQQVNKYCPAIMPADLLAYPAGVRAQAVLSDGSLVHDFLFAESQRSLHVCNAPSPAATSAIPIGEYLCDRIAERTV